MNNTAIENTDSALLDFIGVVKSQMPWWWVNDLEIKKIKCNSFSYDYRSIEPAWWYSMKITQPFLDPIEHHKLDIYIDDKCIYSYPMACYYYQQDDDGIRYVFVYYQWKSIVYDIQYIK